MSSSPRGSLPGVCVMNCEAPPATQAITREPGHRTRKTPELPCQADVATTQLLSQEDEDMAVAAAVAMEMEQADGAHRMAKTCRTRSERSGEAWLMLNFQILLLGASSGMRGAKKRFFRLHAILELAPSSVHT